MVDPSRTIDDRFEIERLAGVGGMGRVYRARDRRLGVPVAVKVLHVEGANEQERFAREIETLGALSHPGIVRFVAHGRTPEGEPYLVTEWLDGEDLGARLRRAGLTLAESLALGARAAEALGEAHRLGVIHRDVKPGNLWLVGGKPEDVKILDFGIARMRGRHHTLTQTGAMLGTPGYMAPEQARGDRRLDARADVFSLGCVLFKCLTGRMPFHGDDVMAVLLRLVLEEAPRLGELCPEAPAALEDLIARTLSKDPAARPADGAALAREILSIDHVGGGRAAPIGPSVGLALTTLERLMMCVVIARTNEVAADRALGTHETLVAAPSDAQRALAASLAPHGGELSLLADGALVVAVPSAGAFTDQAARAARSALVVRERCPDAAIAVVAGRGERASRLPMGEVIDRGVALLRTSKRGAIRVDETVAGLVATTFDLRGDEAGLLLHGEREAEGKRTLLGKRTPFIGREREMNVLMAMYDEVANEGVARAAIVTAAPGLGKSRLRFELCARLQRRALGSPPIPSVQGASEPPLRGREAGFELWLGRGDALRAGSPFGLLAPMIRGLAGVVDGEPIDVQRRKLAARVARHVPKDDRVRVAVFVGELAGVPFAPEEHVELGPARRDLRLMGDQIRRAFMDLVAAECGAGPVLLVLDDAHWGDRPSLSLIDDALRSLPDAPLFVLALARPSIDDLFPNLWAERAATSLKLAPLHKKASEKLVREVLGEAALAEVVDRIVGLAGGDAFYLEELIRAVASGESDALPESVLAMVQHRLDGLDAQKRRVLRAASVFGGTVWSGGVMALLGDDERTPAIAEALAHLADRELLHHRPLSRFPGHDEYVFRQTLVREAAYATLTEADRRLGHRLAAAWLSRAGETDAGVIASHHERGGEPEHALASYRRAATQALEGNDLDQALDWCERAIGSSAEPPDGTHAELGAVWLVMAEALRWRDDLARAEPSAICAMRLLPRGSDAWFIAAGEVAILAGRLGHAPRLFAVADDLLALWCADPSASQVMSTARTGAFLVLAGAYDRADQLLARVTEIEPSVSDPGARARIDQALASRAMVSGDLGVHLARTEAAIAHFSAAGDQRNACLSRITASFAETSVGRFDAAARELREALATATHMALPALAAYAKHTLGFTLAELGELTEAARLEAEAVASFEAHGDARLEGGSRVYLAQIHARRGFLHRAESELDRALDTASAVPAVRAYALAARARIRLSLSRPEEALSDAEHAYSVLTDLGGIEEGESLVRLAYAEALIASGKHDEAQRALADAKQRLMDRAARITDEAVREGLLRGVPENARLLAMAEGSEPRA